jgi:phenylpropionate dioxygenase-like ring-hydroxylating dioxygenase large terminal subunit
MLFGKPGHARTDRPPDKESSMTDTKLDQPYSCTAPHDMVQALVEHLRNGTTDLCDEVVMLEPAIFTDPDVARRERRGVFGRVPFIAAHRSELRDPHDFITKKLPNNEVIIVRLGDGSVRTFVNMCRHRGATLKMEASGHCRVFSCAYHGWAYDLDGSLRNITYADSFGDVDVDQLGLVQLPCEERHGFIWVVDNPAATIDVAAWLGPETDAFLASYGIEHLECYHSGTFEEPTNWKIMHDAFLDGYHIKFAHPNSAGRVIHTNTYVVEDYERHARFISPRKSLDAWLERDPGEDEEMVEHVMLTHFIGPNCTLLQLPDNFQVLTFYPISDDPFESRMEMRLLVPPRSQSDLDEEAWKAKWDKNWHILQQVLAGEDFPILRGIQKAYGNEVSTPTVLGRNEILNQAFHREIAHLRGDA